MESIDPISRLRRWVGWVFLLFAAFLPFYGAYLDWLMYWAGSWDRPTLIRMAMCVAGTALLVAFASLVAPDDPVPTSANGRRRSKVPSPEALPVIPRIGLAVLLGTGVALFIVGALPTIVVYSVCDFGVGGQSLAAHYCRRQNSNAVLNIMGLVGFGSFVLTALLLNVLSRQRAKTGATG